MTLRMIRYGMLAGFAFLLAVAVLERVTARPGGSGTHTGAGLETDVSNQVWQVLAEARRIVEESA
jgi:hypothetical protein